MDTCRRIYFGGVRDMKKFLLAGSLIGLIAAIAKTEHMIYNYVW
jgi:hypothetical protein